MPRSLHRMHDEYRADQLLAYMRAHSDVDLLDLRDIVTAAKPGALLYHLYNTHWNDRGALAGYQCDCGPPSDMAAVNPPVEPRGFH